MLRDNPDSPRDVALLLWEQMGRHGLTVSICCGPCGAEPFGWSVDMMGPDGACLSRPYAARSLDHAIDIAWHEATERGWLA